MTKAYNIIKKIIKNNIKQKNIKIIANSNDALKLAYKNQK